MKRLTDEEVSRPLYSYDAAVRAENGCFAGVDEAGRGPLCGPVCVAACILDPDRPVWGINDSKKLTEKKREQLFEEIQARALAYSIVFVGPDVIDRDNILRATMDGMRQAVDTMDGMRQAVEQLAVTPGLVLVDGNRCPQGLAMPARPVVKGDATSASIGAASILAKVSRDRYMLELDRQYPQYQLAKHKGYPTRLHYELIARYGIQPFYRRSFLKKLGYPGRGDRPDPPGPGGDGHLLRGQDPHQPGRGLPARRLGHPGQAPPDRPDGGLVPAADRPAGGLCAVRCGGSDPS